MIQVIKRMKENVLINFITRLQNPEIPRNPTSLFKFDLKYWYFLNIRKAKFILNELAEKKREKQRLQEQLEQIDSDIEDLQGRLLKERSRTSSVSDNIKIFEGFSGPALRGNRPQRAYSTVYEKRKSATPSSYVDLWIMSDKSGTDQSEGVKVPESFVKPVSQDDEQTPTTASNKPMKEEEYYSLPPPIQTTQPPVSDDYAHYEEPPAEIPPTIPQKSQRDQVMHSKSVRPIPSPAKECDLDRFKNFTIPASSNLDQSMDEPVYMNYQTIDDIIKQDPTKAEYSEDSEHELLDEPDNPEAKLVDHKTVRNLEEAAMFNQRKLIIDKFHESERKYNTYLGVLLERKSNLEKLNSPEYKTSGHSAAPLSTSEIKTVFFNIPELKREQDQLVKYIKTKLNEWKPGKPHIFIYM